MFDEEYNRTTQKMADTAMEYAAQFVARSYLDEYKKAADDVRGAFVPAQFDEKMYKRISKEARKASSPLLQKLKTGCRIAISFVFLLCLAFTIFIFAAEPLREAVFSFVSTNFTP